MSELYTASTLSKFSDNELERTEVFLLLYSIANLNEYEKNAKKIEMIPSEPLNEPLNIDGKIYIPRNKRQGD